MFDSIRKKKRKLSKPKIIIISVFILIIVVLCMISFAKVGTPNFIRAGYGDYQITYNNKDYCKIGTWPKVILASPNDSYTSFEQYLEENNYEIVDRSGSEIMIQKEGKDKTEEVDFGVNGYYSLWKWI